MNSEKQNGHRRLHQYLATLSVSFNAITAGMHYGWTSPSLPKLLGTNSEISITNDQGSWIAVIILVGAICGDFLAGATLDRFGRKLVILSTSIPFLVAWIMIAFANSVTVLLIARFLAGISDGLIFCSIPMYLAEISEPEIRGFLGTSMIISLALGFLIINVIGSYMSITTAALVSTIFPVLLLLTFCWMPESPYFFIMKGKMKQAKQSLRKFRSNVDADEELRRISKTIEEQNVNKGKWWNLFSEKANRKALFIVMGMRTIHQCSGSLAIGFYLQMIFKETGHGISPEIASIVYLSVSLAASGLSSLFIDKAGRKPLIIIATVGSCLTLLIEGCYFYVKNTTSLKTDSYTLIPILALVAFVILFNVGLQSTPLLLLSELFPTNIKTFAFSVNDVYYCVSSIIASKFFQFTKDEFGIHVPFLAFSLCCAMGVLFAVFCVPETKGKTLEQIQNELRGRRDSLNLPEIQTMIQKK